MRRVLLHLLTQPVPMSKYKFNKEQLSFTEDKKGIAGMLKTAFRYLFGSVLLAILYYIVFALLFNTGREERMQRENDLLNAEYQRSTEKLELLDKVINDLKVKDREIYMNIFKSDPPDMISEYNPSIYSQLDTSSDITLVNQTSDKVKFAEYLANEQFKRIESIYNFLETKDSVTYLPSSFPLENLSVSQTGVGVGMKIHPFYKTKVEHKGIDLLSGIGTEVLATAEGTVVSVTRSERDRGNQIRIDHGNGYETYYAHLGEMFVRNGQKVSKGSVIARVGNSGLSFAPHLHYEISLNKTTVDPVNYFFAELDPYNYRDMLVIALNNGQSLD